MEILTNIELIQIDGGNDACVEDIPCVSDDYSVQTGFNLGHTIGGIITDTIDDIKYFIDLL